MTLPASPRGRASLLRRQGYQRIRQALSPEVCAQITHYARLQATLHPDRRDPQVPGAHSVYADPLIETLEEMLLPALESWTGERLWPTYGYHRIYRFGDTLAPHTDRPSCEVSLTLCLGFDRGSQPARYRWPLLIDALPQRGRTSGRLAVSCRMEPGDAVVYLGPQVRHWRTAFKGLWQVQAFLHYVSRDNPHADFLRFDGRPGLGLPETSRDPVRNAQMQLLTLSRQRDDTLKAAIEAEHQTCRPATRGLIAARPK